MNCINKISCTWSHFIEQTNYSNFFTLYETNKETRLRNFSVVDSVAKITSTSLSLIFSPPDPKVKFREGKSFMLRLRVTAVFVVNCS